MATRPGNILKFCPKCGSIHFIYDGLRSFLCDNCGFNYFVNSSSAVAAIIENGNGEILLAVRAFDPAKGKLDLPGGFVDPMESAEDAIKREIKEELNLDVISMQYLVSFPNEYIFKGFSVYTTDLAFVCEVDDFINITSNDDISAYRFFSADDIDFNEISCDSIRDILKFYIARKSVQNV